MQWYMYALVTVICLGFHLNALSHSTKIVSPIFVFWLPFVPLTILLPFYWKTMVTDFHSVINGTTQLQILILTSMCLSVTGTLAFFKAIQMSGNPTLVGLIEITYPISVALIGGLLFKEQQVNPSMLLGGVLILIGSGIVMFNNS